MTVTLRPKRNIRSITGSIDDFGRELDVPNSCSDCLTVRQGSRQNRCCISVFKTANATAEAAFNVFPHPLDHPLVVVAVGKIDSVEKQCFWHVFFISLN
jgi:hypothetical protein